MFTIELDNVNLTWLEEMFLLEGENFTAGIPVDCTFIPRIKGTGDTTEEVTTDHTPVRDPWD